MRVVIELSGEQPALARAEATAVVQALGGTIEQATGRTVHARGVEAEALAGRLALADRILEHVATVAPTLQAIVDTADAVPLDGGTFAVRCTRLAPGLDASLPQAVARELGQALSERGTVDLEAPEQVVRVLVTQDEAVVGVQRARVDRPSFEARHVEERPFFSPVSLHPRLARALVNLTGVQAGERLWDPFCGTGGIPLEAALIGAQAIGSDLDEAMVDGTRETLSAFDQEAVVRTEDVAQVAGELGTVDAVATDPPYGRASSTHREDLHALYKRFFQAAAEVLAPGGRVACILPRLEEAELAGDAFELLDTFAWYVHGSLTRHVLVYQRC